LKAGADPRRKFKGFDALSHAAGSGSMEVVQALAPRKGLTPNDAATGLPYAAWGGNTRILDYFIKPLPASLDMSLHFTNGLNESCLFGHVDAARWHLNHGALANGTAETPITPLLAALIPGPPEKNNKVKRELLELLLNAGANPNITRNGVAPLLLAAEFGDADAVQLLLKARAKVTVTDHRGFGVLAWAARGRQSVDVVKLLLEAGADVDRMDPNDETALIAFAQLGDVAACKLLLDSGADVNASAWMSATAITQAAGSFMCREEEAAAMVSFLKSRGARLDTIKNEVRGAFVEAIHSGRPAVVESVIKAGADPNQDFGQGIRPVHLASAMSNRAVVAKLVELGADPKVLDEASLSALCHAAAAGRTDIIGFLLERGLSPEGPDGSMSPLGVAVGVGQISVVRQLLAAGAKPNARDAKSGKSILQLANEDKLIHEVLMNAGARDE
jgi:ankyrin repeat protein